MADVCKTRISFVCFLSAVLVLAAFFNFYSQNIFDADSLYHFRHAAIYRAAGFGTADFPWVSYSVIRAFSADIWYGFHLLLTPFTYFSDPVFGLRLAGVFIITFLFWAFWYAVRRLGAVKTFFWPFLLFFSSPFASYHLLMARPHVVSLALNVLLFAFLAAGNLWGVFLAAAGVGFFHLGLFWSVLAVAGIWTLVKWWSEKIFAWREILSVLAGLTAGWLLRPNPWGATKITYAQIVRLMLEKQAGTPLNFGMELYPLPMRDWAGFFWFAVLWIAAIAIFAAAVFAGRIIEPRLKTILWGSLALSVVFGLMTMLLAERSFDFWLAFGVMFIALTFTFLLGAARRKFAMIFIAAIFVIMAIFGTYKTLWLIKNVGTDPYRFRPAAEWLQDNSEKGDVVFNVSWDYFPQLFFWNIKNVYISGMDPIFQYVYNPKMYWEAYYLETGHTTQYTCAATACAPEELEETYGVLVRDFHARYVFLDKSFDGGLYNYFLADKRFVVRHEDGNTAIFEIR